MKAFTEISMAERLINSGECNEAADRLLQAKVIMLSMLTSEELEFMEKLADGTAKEGGKKECQTHQTNPSSDLQ